MTSPSNIIWDQALIEKYNYSGPRYTSYPTAVEFNESFTEEQFKAACLAYPERPLSLYLHIPFCHKLCYFCGCNKIITRHAHKADEYLIYLEKEVKTRSELLKTRKVTQLHLGGGTPTFLTKAQFSQLMQLLRSHFNIDSSAEISIEVDPREIELDMLDHLSHLGFNRISLGVQDFNKDVQIAVNREQDNDFVLALLERAKQVGFKSTNLDLIYGLPYQTSESFTHTIDKLIEIKPSRLSIFNYAHIPTLFPAQRKIDEDALPSPQEKLVLLQMTIERLTQAGYQFIGMDHFALPDDELAIAQRNGTLHRNFQGYTTHKECDLLGLGVSAISMMGDSYSQNKKVLSEYYDDVTAHNTALWRGIPVSQDDLIRRDVITTLICHFALSKTDIEQRYQLNFNEYFHEDLELLKPFIGDEMVSITVQDIQVNAKGRLLIRNICMCFDKYLRDKARQQKFSRVI